MPSISRIYGYYAHDFSDYDKLIGLEIRKVDPTAIVSIDEFIESVLRPAVERNAFLGKNLSPLKRRIDKTLFHWADHEDVPSFQIKDVMIPHYLNDLMSERSVPKMNKVQLINEIKKLIQQPDIDRTDIQRTYPALYSGTIIHAINTVAGQDNYLFNALKPALWRGDGLGVLQFWQRLNTLHDYSANFPNKINLPRGGKKDSRLSFGGIFGGKLQPT